MSNLGNHIIDDFIGWDATNGILFPRFHMNYEAWRDAIKNHPFRNKFFLLSLIQRVAEVAYLAEFPKNVYNWQLLPVLLQKMIDNREF